MTTNVTLPFTRDTMRYHYCVRESNQHQAKFEMRTLKWLIQRYTSVGDTILDPMSGVGTIHMANFMGRHTIACELVPSFVQLQHENRAQMLNLWNGGEFYDTDMATYEDWDYRSPTWDQISTYTILEGDCRRTLPLTTPVDAVIFSPPYGDLWKFDAKGRDNKVSQEKNFVVGYDDNAAQVGNLTNRTQYLQVMQTIYQRCYESLKPGGTLVILVKDYLKGGQRVYCSRDNMQRAMNVGFRPTEWHFRDASVQNNPFAHNARAARQRKGTDYDELNVKKEDIVVLIKS